MELVAVWVNLTAAPVTAALLESSTEPTTMALSACCPKLLAVGSRNRKPNAIHVKPLLIRMESSPGFRFGLKPPGDWWGGRFSKLCLPRMGRAISVLCFLFPFGAATRSDFHSLIDFDNMPFMNH